MSMGGKRSLLVLSLALALGGIPSLAWPETIQFNVYDRDTGVHLDAVHVVFLNADNAVQIAAADIAGSGTLNVPVGRYRVRFSEGVLGTVLYFVQWAGTSEPNDMFSSATAINVPADATTTISQGLAGSYANPPAHGHWDGIITGSVTGAAGSSLLPLSGIEVSFLDAENALLHGCSPFKPGVEPPPPAVTDANGFFSCALSQVDNVGMKVRFFDPTGAYRAEFFGARGEDLFDLGQMIDASEPPEISEQMVQDTPAEATHDLVGDIADTTWPDAVKTSLTNPLDSAIAVLEDKVPSNDRAACGHLKSFREQLQGKVASGALTQAEAAQLDTGAQSIQQDIGCKSSVPNPTAIPTSTPTATPTPTSHPASIVTQGQVGHLLLRGTVVTPDTVLQGEVLIEGDTITCVANSCAGASGADVASVVDTAGIILPGLIDTHNHVLFDVFDETDWSPMHPYSNHTQWPSEARYGAMVDAQQYLNSVGSPFIDLGCELDKYGEIKGLVAGTTSIVGAAQPVNRVCYGTLARTIDESPNGLGADKIQVASSLPSTVAADGVCARFASGETDAYLVHVGEGTDQVARTEFSLLGAISTVDGCLYAHQTAIVQGIALGNAEFTTMGQAGMSLVWSPRSNVFLYGGGTDLTKTANVPLALSKNINVALGPDWSIGGSQNLLDELRFADHVDNSVWGDQLSPKMLTQMVTINAAKVLGLDSVLGSLAVGKKADVMVIGGDSSSPYDALLAAQPADVRLVLVGGVALYGDPALQGLGPAIPGCEALNVCSQNKFICVAAPTQSVADKLDQTLADITTNLATELANYDGLDLSAWDFSPLAPIVRCP